MLPVATLTRRVYRRGQAPHLPGNGALRDADLALGKQRDAERREHVLRKAV